MTDVQKKDLMDSIVMFNESTTEKGIEMSVVKKEYCQNFIYPTPFELHFSNMYLDWYKQSPKEYIRKMNGTDPDLAAHFVITKKFGQTLYGAAISEIFGDIPMNAYLDSIISDIAEAETDKNLKIDETIALAFCQYMKAEIESFHLIN